VAGTCTFPTRSTQNNIIIDKEEGVDGPSVPPYVSRQALGKPIHSFWGLDAENIQLLDGPEF